jgi:hypothetical protein
MGTKLILEKSVSYRVTNSIGDSIWSINYGSINQLVDSSIIFSIKGSTEEILDDLVFGFVSSSINGSIINKL